MRLLNVKNLQLETFFSSGVPEYAALSHTWGDDEVTFQDLLIDSSRKKKGWTKILGSAAEAKKLSCNYIWVDTCCIDKKSKFCFAYLEDISPEPERKIIEIESNFKIVTPPCAPPSARELLHNSRWFKRGWTLQELVAPKTLFFYDSTWKKIGEKRELQKEVSKTTGIDLDVLHDHRLLPTKSIAQRMSWASKRETTRTEDIAYCLMGLFNVNMPLLYGEGGRAFIRLQEEIMRSNHDHSLFAWNHNFPNTILGTSYALENDSLLGVGVLAPHPVAFSSSAHIIPHIMKKEPYTMTNKGLQIRLYIFEQNLRDSAQTHLAMLKCGYKNKLSTAIAIPLVSTSQDEFCRAIDQDFVEFRYSEYLEDEYDRVQQVYILGAGPQLRSRGLGSIHRCWLREFSEDQGLTFHEARYCEYPIKSQGSDDALHFWNHENKSMSWDKNWSGARAVVYLSKEYGPSFAIILTFTHSSNRDSDVRKYVQIRQLPLNGTEGPPHRGLNQVLLEDTPLGDGGIFDAQTTLTFKDRIMTAELKSEYIFGNHMFVLDISVERKRWELRFGPVMFLI